MATDEKEPFRVRCLECGHRWVAAYLPMRMDLMATLLQSLHCPSCAAPSKLIFVADEPAIEGTTA